MKYGLIGEKLGHSFSKIIHSKLFDYEYELKELSARELEGFMRSCGFEGINVTIPYKEAVIPFLDEISENAAEIGAVNTVINRNGKLYGDNTDFHGMKALIERAGIAIEGKRVLILGSGGTSKTAFAVVKSLGCATAERVSRRGGDCITYAEAAERKDTDVIINTTPCGMFPDIGKSAIDISNFPALSGVVDAVYNPLRSKLVSDALSRGIPAVGGLYMLVAQAAAAAELFAGEKVSKEKTELIYRELAAEKQNIVLVGMPSGGKTTVGKIISNRLGMPFIDTDELIVSHAGKPISSIISELGEEGFRELEAEAIREASAMQGVVVATGGGAILRRENTDLLKENGRIYFLDRPLDELIPSNDRPLSADRASLEKRFKERYPIYCSCCDCRIASPETPERAADMIEENVKNENFSC